MQKLLSARFLRLVFALTCGLLAVPAPAAVSYYFHVNGTSPGYGISANDNIIFEGFTWTSSSTGAPTNTWAVISGNNAAAGFARFNSTTTPYTVTLTNTDIMAGMFGASGVTLTINATNGGNFFLVTNTVLAGLPAQGFFPAGGTVVINAPITGPGAIVPQTSGGGTLKLMGTNTYTGGTVLNSSAVLVYFNNNSSFGPGPIVINNTTFAPLLGTGGSTITLANTWTNMATDGVNFAADANTPVVLSGPLLLQTFGLNLRNNGPASSPVTWQGAISGTGGTLNLSANSGGTIVLSGPNTYTGPTTIGVGGNAGANVTLSVGSLNRISGGSPSSNLGAPTTVANGTIGMGSIAVPATLIYTGAGETSDRVINLSGTTGSATIQADGTGPLAFTSANTATGLGPKTLTLQGSNTGTNSFTGKIVDSTGGATTLVKAQAGTWMLTGTNTYSGGTVVNSGTLEIGATGVLSGSVTNNSGILVLDAPTCLSSATTLALSSSTTTNNLNFTGSQNLIALVIDGSPMPTGTYGAPGSSAVNQYSFFTGTGIITVLGSPVILQQPQSQTVFAGSSVNFNVTVAGDPSFVFQWYSNNVAIPGATADNVTISPVVAGANLYVAITNNFGHTNSATAVLGVQATNAYTLAVVSLNTSGGAPIAYWRLGETNGGVAHDSLNWFGTNNGFFTNATINQPGFSLTDPDPAIALPTDASNLATNRGFVKISNFAPFNFTAASQYTLEGWVRSTNFTSKQRLFSTLSLTAPGGYAFGILPGGTALEFTAGAVRDTDTTALPTTLVAGTWYHLVLTCDGSTYTFYVNGNPFFSASVSGGASAGVGVPLLLGANPPAYYIAPGDHGAEQVKGEIDEMAIYNYALSGFDVTNHFNARYGTLAVPLVSAPSAVPPTNYVNLSASLVANAAGQALSYQWHTGVAPGGPALSDGGNISGSSSATLTISPLDLTNGTTYWVAVSNPAGNSNSPSTALVVLPIPTNSSQLNLTNGLVLHLPFDANYLDISGRSNNGTNVGATYLTNTAVVGTNALHYNSDSGSSSYNYVTVGMRPDLKFSSNVDFTVSYWVRQPAGSTFISLPFFSDVVGGVGGITLLRPGFAFAPYATNGNGGGWQLGLSGTAHAMTSPSQFTSFPDANLINDGNWHLVTHVATRVASVVTYYDGVQMDSEAVSIVDNMDNTNSANLGQDATGAYAVTAEADLDDVAVWRRALSSLEVSGIYLAGATNGVSFAPTVANAPAATPVTITGISATAITYTGGAGSQFVLLGTNNISAPLSSWGRLATNSVTPGSFPINATGPQKFYSIKSE